MLYCTTGVVVDCGKLESPENGSVDYSGTHLGAFAKYVCQTGYVIVGYNFRKCLLDGWSGEEPTCKRKGKKQTIISTE